MACIYIIEKNCPFRSEIVEFYTLFVRNFTHNSAAVVEQIGQPGSHFYAQKQPERRQSPPFRLL